jgi:hypothetical protein
MTRADRYGLDAHSCGTRRSRCASRDERRLCTSQTLPAGVHNSAREPRIITALARSIFNEMMTLRVGSQPGTERRLPHLRSTDATIDCGVSSTPKRFCAFGPEDHGGAPNAPASNAAPPIDNSLRLSILTASIALAKCLAPADALPQSSAFRLRIFNVRRECAVRCGKNRGRFSALARQAFDQSCRGPGSSLTANAEPHHFYCAEGAVPRPLVASVGDAIRCAVTAT